MTQESRNRVILIIWLAVKLLVTARYFYDTYTVAVGEGAPSGIAVLDGVLIDGVFAALWVVLSFGGQGRAMMAIRPFAAAGAWLLYLLMLRVADTNGSIALLARVAGGLGLAYDTLDILLAWLRRGWQVAGERIRSLRAARRTLTLAERQAEVRARAWRGAYGLALLFLRPVVWVASGVLVLADLYADARIAWRSAALAHANALHLHSPVGNTPALPQAAAVRYEETSSGDWLAVCATCGWRSKPAASRAVASRAYSAHTRGAAHRAALRMDVHVVAGD